jgi:DNA-binding IclR family transcriptional regulator
LEVHCSKSAETPGTRRQEITPDLVKSSGRTIQILEYFADLRHEATICEVSRALGYPQSSTAALLHTLTEMGYMAFDRKTRTYRPTNSVAMLGAWVDQRLARSGPIPALMEAVADRTGDIVLLGRRNGLYLKFIHVIQSPNPARHCSVGTMRPLVNSGAGLAILSALPDAEIKRIAMRSNASGVALSPVNHADLVRAVESFRSMGYSITPTFAAGISVLSVALPDPSGDAPMVLAIGGVDEDLRANYPQLLSFLKSEMSVRLGARCPFKGPQPVPAYAA